MQPRAVLFDMDGVLVKSFEMWFRAVELAGVRFRGRPITRAEFAPTFGQGTAADVSAFGLRCTPAELDRFYEAEFLEHRDALWVNPEAGPLLELLAARGVQRALVTNTVAPIVRELLPLTGFGHLLTSLATADRVAHAKPAPDLVLLACADLGVRPAEAWMVGDSRFDRQAAQTAGVRFVGLELDGDARIEQLSQLPSLLWPKGSP